MRPNPALRSTLHKIASLTLTLLTRTTITGQENIPAHGPLLILANHSSTIDPMLLGMGLPETTEGVGAGDFKLLFPANVIMAWYGLIPVKRTLQMDRASLKLMTDMLNAGKMLSLFPQGGTWEKPITDAKSGAAYLSMTTGASILPVALGGTYRAWDKVVRLQRPHLTLNIGKVMPPIEAPPKKSKRGEVLDAATQEIMQRIYELLPTTDQRWYDELAATRYNLDVEIWRWKTREPIRLPGSAVLAEVLLKPNLISPLVNNAKLPLGPMLKYGIHFPPDLIRIAATSLQAALHGPYQGYMEYRLGIDKSQELYTALNALIDLTNSPGVGQIALKPTSSRV